MKTIKDFVITTILGGIVVVLPVLITAFFLKWLFAIITGLIHPLTQILVERSNLQRFLADIVVIIAMIIVCFFIGLSIKTRLGKFFFKLIEQKILKIAPGYSLFKETIKQFLGQRRKPFYSVALVRIFETPVLLTAFVTDEHEDGSYTVFVPSGLNPTSGVIYHLDKQRVFLLDVSVEDTMRSVISCGAGSKTLLENYFAKYKKTLMAT